MTSWAWKCCCFQWRIDHDRSAVLVRSNRSRMWGETAPEGFMFLKRCICDHPWNKSVYWNGKRLQAGKNSGLNEELSSVLAQWKTILNAVKSLQSMLGTELEDTKCLLRSIDTAATGLGFSAELRRRVPLWRVPEVPHQLKKVCAGGDWETKAPPCSVTEIPFCSARTSRSSGSKREFYFRPIMSISSDSAKKLKISDSLDSPSIVLNTSSLS